MFVLAYVYVCFVLVRWGYITPAERAFMTRSAAIQIVTEAAILPIWGFVTIYVFGALYLVAVGYRKSRP